jgi:hypothetical protein
MGKSRMMQNIVYYVLGIPNHISSLGISVVDTRQILKNHHIFCELSYEKSSGNYSSNPHP